MAEYTELESCIPKPVQSDRFNPRAVLPYGLAIEHVQSAMLELVDFLGFINTQLHTKEIARLEKMLMPANFSSVIGEFVAAAIPKFCQTLVKNRYHNGHPDLIPNELFPGDAVQHSDRGIEVKSSRYLSGWQGHNPEDVRLMVFVFDCNRPTDNAARPFRFLRVVGARLEKGRLDVFRSFSHQSQNNHGERYQIWLRKNDGKLDL